MNYIKTLKEFLIESFGISSDIKKFTPIIYDAIKYNINNNINDNLFIDLSNYATDFKLGIVFVDWKLANSNFGLFDPEKSEFDDETDNDILNYVKLVVGIDKNNLSETKIKEIITHELTHALEYYKIKIKEREIGVEVYIDPKYLSIRKSINSVQCPDHDINYLKVLIYYSLDTEMNARVAQLYQTLSDMNTKDTDLLTQKVYSSESYIFYNKLELFNSKNYLDYVINKLGIDLTIMYYNELNHYLIENNVNKLNNYKFIKSIKNKQELYDYMLNWEILFKDKNEKHKKKLLRMVASIINESNRTFKKRDYISHRYDQDYNYDDYDYDYK